MSESGQKRSFNSNGGKKDGNNDRKKFKRNNKSKNDDENEGDSRGPWFSNRTERHPGSFPLEEILKSEDYQAKRITQVDPVKRKYVLCISYLGTNYQGLQINPDAHTVEQELEKALLYNGSIIEANYGFFQKVQWSRAARTDRGVHALTQSLAMRLLASKEVDKNVGNARDLFIDQLNSFLPSDIKVQGLIKVNKNFNAHAQCSKRIYHYLLPTYLLQDMNIVTTFLQQKYEQQGPIKGAGYEGGFVDPALSCSLTKDSLREVYQQLRSFRISHEKTNQFRSVLQKFEGTKSFHNYTTAKNEADAKRYILSCTCEEPFVNSVTNVEFIKIIFFGQSFLLNQIRKMIGMSIEVVRGNFSEDYVNLSFSAERLEVPMVPGLGLFLYDIFFDGYNIKLRNENDRLKQSASLKKEKSLDEKGIRDLPVSRIPVSEGNTEALVEENEEADEIDETDSVCLCT
jgi:tRNA pseudouridine38-40 synthase